MAFDSSTFLTQVKLYGAIPTGRFDDEDDILPIANDIMLSDIVPFIIGLREEYFVEYEDQSILAGEAYYDIPYRALGLTMRELKRISNNVIYDIDRMSPEDITSSTQGTPKLFYLEGQSIVLYPEPQADGDTLRVWYPKTPSTVVALTSVAVITLIDTVTGIITAACPSTWTTANTFDFVSSKNGHKNVATDLSASSVTTSTITFSTSDIPSKLRIGDYVCLAGESPFFQVPDVCFTLLVKLTVAKLLESLGDQTGSQSMISECDKLRAGAMALMTNRVEGALKKGKISLI